MAVSKTNDLTQQKSRMNWLFLIPASLTAGLLFMLFSSNSTKTNKDDAVQISSAMVKAEPLTINKNKTSTEVPKKEQSGFVLSSKQHTPKKDLKKYPLFSKNLNQFPSYYQDFVIKHTNIELIERLEECKNLEEAVIVLTKHIDPEFLGYELKSWLDWIEFDLTNPTSTWGGKKFHELDPLKQMNALATYLIKDKHIKYVDKITPDAYNMAKVIERNEGLCSTLPVLFTLISERLKLPVFLVTSRQHVFCRYENGSTRINIESTSPYAMGVGTPDEFYLKEETTGEELISEHELAATTTMKSLNLRQSISVLLLNASAATTKQERFLDNFKRDEANTEEELNNDLQYWTSSYYFNPESYLATRNLLSTVQKYHESFDYNFVYGLRSFAIRKGIIKGNEEDLRLRVAEIEGLRTQHKDLLHMYGTYDMQDLAKVDEFKKETGTRLILLHKYMKANKYLLSEQIEKELSEIKLRYMRLYKWADVK